ncbi:MAG: hypothetical protein HY321_20225 [Armatimonadetes bacterium]|nr:hypothetical protein [Armatimonadota bacterium]
MGEEIVVFVAILGAFGLGALKMITRFLLEWRKSGSSQEISRLSEQLAALQRDYQQTKADHNDTLLGIEATMRQMERRLDGLAGIDAPPPAAEAKTPVASQRQL